MWIAAILFCFQSGSLPESGRVDGRPSFFTEALAPPAIVSPIHSLEDTHDQYIQYLVKQGMNPIWSSYLQTILNHPRLAGIPWQVELNPLTRYTQNIIPIRLRTFNPETEKEHKLTLLNDGRGKVTVRTHSQNFPVRSVQKLFESRVLYLPVWKKVREGWGKRWNGFDPSRSFSVLVRIKQREPADSITQWVLVPYTVSYSELLNEMAKHIPVENLLPDQNQVSLMHKVVYVKGYGSLPSTRADTVTPLPFVRVSVSPDLLTGNQIPISNLEVMPRYLRLVLSELSLLRAFTQGHIVVLINGQAVTQLTRKLVAGDLVQISSRRCA